MKRVFIIHGWESNPEDGWFPWLKKELEAKGFEVFVPAMPEANAPKIHSWVPALSGAVGEPDKDTYFVGHSMGCQAIARYLEALPENKKVGGVVFVAGFFKRLTEIGDDQEEQEIVEHWLGAPINFDKIKLHSDNYVAIFSDNDPFVPLDNQDDFRDKLGAKIIVEHKKGHFSGPLDRIKILPIVLENILNISK